MLDTMTFTKAAGGLCGAFLVYLLGGWAGEVLFHTGGGHGDHAEQAYMIEVDDADSGPAEEEVEVDFVAMVAAADAAKGEKVFGKCKACHKVDGTDGTGPHLNGVVGRDIGAVDGFGYSDVLTSLEGNWSEDALNEFLTNPKGYAPGTKMSFAGLRKIGDRANIVAYLAGL